ncbi:MAG: hypothetical protein KM310_00700 [Clostridiales bacterium]|nr:hypothetical protein [Clostridiales bacterium]
MWGYRQFLQVLIPVLTVLIVSSVAFAMMASNTVPPSRAGSGANTISGYAVTNVKYDIDDGNDTIIGIRFDLDHSARIVYAKLSDGNTTYLYNCSLQSGNTWSCSPANNPISVKDAIDLQVVAAQ